MNPPPTLLELAKACTPGPWTLTHTGDRKRYILGENQSSWGTDVGEIYSDDTDANEAKANATLIARLSPDVAVRVYLAIKAAALDTATFLNNEDPNNEEEEFDRTRANLKELRSALAILDGKSYFATEDKA